MEELASAAQLAALAAAIIGGWLAGRRGVARQTVDLLQIQVNTLTTSNAEKETELIAIRTRVEVLEGLVTQRAEVEQVRQIVERIAAKVDA